MILKEEDFFLYEEITLKLNYICNEWARQNLMDWQEYYGDWEISNDNILIWYYFNDYINNVDTCRESDCVKVTIKELIEFYDDFF